MNKRFSIRNIYPSFILLPIMIYWAVNRGNYTMIDSADLVIHEAGHIFFMIFGRFVHVLGGTLMQMLLPLLIAFYFLRNSYRTGLQVALMWTGQNLINISVYAADAMARKLPLLGGNKAGHDWHYLLGRLGLLEFSAEVGYIFYAVALLVFLIAFLLPVFISPTITTDFE